MKNFEGVIIEESLEDTSVLNDIQIISTEVEPVTEQHKTPWVMQWTMHTVEIPVEKALYVAEKIALALDSKHNWYADYKTDSEHYIIFRNKIFYVTDRSDEKQYCEATRYGISIGIPEYQVDFAQNVTRWER